MVDGCSEIFAYGRLRFQRQRTPKPRMQTHRTMPCVNGLPKFLAYNRVCAKASLHSNFPRSARERMCRWRTEHRVCRRYGTGHDTRDIDDGNHTARGTTASNIATRDDHNDGTGKTARRRNARDGFRTVGLGCRTYNVPRKPDTHILRHWPCSEDNASCPLEVSGTRHDRLVAGW